MAHDAGVILQVLIDLHRNLAVETRLDQALHLVARTTLAVLDAEHASIRVLDESGAELLSGARAGAGVEQVPVTFGRGLGIAGWVVDNAELARVADVRDDPRFVTVSGQGFDIRSILAAPLTIGGSVIGVLCGTSSRTNAFTDGHEDLALMLASVAASPIERARLERIAMSDPRTRAWSTRYLGPLLASEAQRGSRTRSTFSLLALEIHSWNELRRALGRPVSEALLRVVAERINHVSGPRDALVRRDGGEFLIVLPDLSEADALERGAAIEAIMRRPFAELRGLDVALQISFGAAEWDGAESGSRLERRADEALRCARSATVQL